MNRILTIARKSAFDEWLDKNPLVLGLLFLTIGGVLLFFGIKEWQSGVARDKYGKKMTGGMGKFTAGCRIVGGIGACGFALYKMIMG